MLLLSLVLLQCQFRCRHLRNLIQVRPWLSYCWKLDWGGMKRCTSAHCSNKPFPRHCVVAAMSEKGGRGFGTLGFQEAQARELAAATGFTRFEVRCCSEQQIIVEQLDGPVHWKSKHTWKQK